MSTVALTIGPKTYNIACADGEEAHVTTLGAIIAEKYAQLGSSRAPLEAQNLLFAALFLADELAELRKNSAVKAEVAATPPPEVDPQAVAALRAAIAQLEDDLAAARAATPDVPASLPQTELFSVPEPDPQLVAQLEKLAERLEASASALEAAAANA
jgi:cell division protein ZapA